MFEYVPGNAECDEEYWHALLEEGEKSRSPAPLAPPLETDWKPSRAPISSPPPSDTGEWASARQAMEERQTLELRVSGYNRGGLLVDWNGKQEGFIPISHLQGIPQNLDREEMDAILRGRVGQTLSLQVIEVDPARRRIVLSERATSAEEEHSRRLFETLQPGDIRKGRVTTLSPFGAFVDLGGVEGLVHVSEIAWKRVDHPADLLAPDQEVTVMVLNVDSARRRIGLSIKRTQPNPWRAVAERYKVGQIVEARITSVMDFGAFAEVEEGVEGLIHASELVEGQFMHPRNVVHEGQMVKVRVIKVDASRHRLGFSLQQVPVE